MNNLIKSRRPKSERRFSLCCSNRNLFCFPTNRVCVYKRYIGGALFLFFISSLLLLSSSAPYQKNKRCANRGQRTEKAPLSLLSHKLKSISGISKKRKRLLPRYSFPKMDIINLCDASIIAYFKKIVNIFIFCAEHYFEMNLIYFLF